MSHAIYASVDNVALPVMSRLERPSYYPTLSTDAAHAGKLHHQIKQPLQVFGLTLRANPN